MFLQILKLLSKPCHFSAKVLKLSQSLPGCKLEFQLLLGIFLEIYVRPGTPITAGCAVLLRTVTALFNERSKGAPLLFVQFYCTLCSNILFSGGTVVVRSLALLVIEVRKVIFYIEEVPEILSVVVNVLIGVVELIEAVRFSPRSIDEAIRLRPSFAEAYYNRGIIKLKIGLHDDALLDFSKAGEYGLEFAYEIIKRLRAVL